jgi:hypothetical protein
MAQSGRRSRAQGVISGGIVISRNFFAKRREKLAFAFSLSG